MTDRPPMPSDNGGFVLIAVLGVLALLSAMVVVVLGASRDAVNAALLSSLETRRQALLQSGLSLAAYELVQLGLPIDGVNNQQFRFDDGTVTLTVTTDAGKVESERIGQGSARGCL